MNGAPDELPLEVLKRFQSTYAPQSGLLPFPDMIKRGGYRLGQDLPIVRSPDSPGCHPEETESMTL